MSFFSSDEEEEDNKTPINKGFDDKAALGNIVFWDFLS